MPSGSQFASAGSGAAGGAALGTAIFPGIGTAVGAIAGALGGALLSGGGRAKRALRDQKRKRLQLLREGAGQSQATILRSAGEQRASADQGLVDRGLFNSTIRDGVHADINARASRQISDNNADIASGLEAVEADYTPVGSDPAATGQAFGSLIASLAGAFTRPPNNAPTGNPNAGGPVPALGPGSDGSIPGAFGGGGGGLTGVLSGALQAPRPAGYPSPTDQPSILGSLDAQQMSAGQSQTAYRRPVAKRRGLGALARSVQTLDY